MKAKALEICKEIKEAGGTPYFVGGFVRDALMGISSRDIDIEVFGLDRYELEEALAKFGKVDLVGKQYGVYKCEGIDISIPRRDVQSGTSHKEVEVELDISMTVKEAAKRRDLTINAIYMDPFTQTFIDPLGGILDITCNKAIYPASLEQFCEDPLRPIRVARFKALFPQLNVMPTTIDVCTDVTDEALKTIPADRIFGELRKVLMEAPVPSVFFHTLDAIGATAVVFPELHAMKSIQQGFKHHPEGDVYTHTLMALDITPVEDRKLDVMLAILFHDLGKALVSPEDKGEGHVAFKGHAEATELAEVALSRITKDKQLTESVLKLISFHMRPYDLKDEVTKKKVRRLASVVDLPKLMQIHIADKLGRGMHLPFVKHDNLIVPTEILKIYKEIQDEIKPLLKGTDLIAAGLEPGKYFGKILAELYEMQLEEVFGNREEALGFLSRYIADNGLG